MSTSLRSATKKGSGVFFRIGPTAVRQIQPGRRPIRKKTPDPLGSAVPGTLNTCFFAIAHHHWSIKPSRFTKMIPPTSADPIDATSTAAPAISSAKAM